MAKIKISKKDFQELASKTAEESRRELLEDAPFDMCIAFTLMILEYQIRLTNKLFEE